MIGVTYSVNNELYAAQDPVFGWSVWVDDGRPCPVDHLYFHYELYGIKQMREMFSGPTYPQELRDAFDAVIAASELKEKQAASELAERYEAAEACAEAMVDKQLQEVRNQVKAFEELNQQALTQIAIMWVGARIAETTSVPEIQRLIRLRAFIMDRVFQFSWREYGAHGKFLTNTDCRVCVKKPATEELAELILGVIPFQR
jgi:regulator of protease activity HflC (stomatin/prohibitin superfamily)